jgi:hypothetical protein
MTTATFTLTTPIFSPAEGVLFSAYRVGSGYWSFTLSYEAACEMLGARTQDREQVMLAFALNQPRIITQSPRRHRPATASESSLNPRTLIEGRAWLARNVACLNSLLLMMDVSP